MWKDFFFFSQGEKNGIKVLLVLIIFVFGVNRMIPYLIDDEPLDISDYKMEIENFQLSLLPEERVKKKSFGERTSVQRSLFYFDPNKSDSLEFIRLGLPPFVISHILKYRLKGGVFKDSESFFRIYGMRRELYSELLPYIKIERLQKSTKTKKYEKREEEVPIESLNLNMADTTALKRLKGIGSVYAGRIVKYRDFLGGFYCLEQLKEVYGISDELFLLLKPYLFIDTSQIKKIKLNKEGLKARLRHPYLSKKQVYALISFLEKNRTIDSLNALNELPEFSDSDLSRLSPYLSFE